MFSSETFVSALFLRARIFLPHFKMSLLCIVPPESAQICLANGSLASRTTIQVPLNTTAHQLPFWRDPWPAVRHVIVGVATIL